MTRATILLAVGAALLAGATNASAQSDELHAFAALYGGAQPQRSNFTATKTFPLFDETATINSDQHVRNSGMGGIGIGFPVKGKLGLGGRVTYAGRPGSATVEAKLPDPAFFDRPKTITLEASGLKHTELGMHVTLLYQLAMSPKLGFTISAGPSIVRLQQDIATTSVTTAGIASIAVDPETATAFGGNGGVDVIYALKPSFGFGIFVHYIYAKATLTAGELNVGGTQAGVALHIGL